MRRVADPAAVVLVVPAAVPVDPVAVVEPVVQVDPVVQVHLAAPALAAQARPVAVQAHPAPTLARPGLQAPLIRRKTADDMPQGMVNANHEGARDLRAPEPNLTRLTFDDLPHMVELRGADAVADALETVLPDWGISRQGHEAESAPTFTKIRSDHEGFSFKSWWAKRPLNKLGVAGATCGVVADLVQAYLDARPGVFGLHCGAVRVGGHLVAFAGTYRAGKSTLVTRLGIEPDCELFCDDVLPIEDRRAVALGVQPRLRMPLPENLSTHLCNYIAQNLTVQDHRYGYVALPNQAPFKTCAPLDAMILLSRQDGAKARFHRLSTSDAAAHLIRQNIADPGEVEDHYDQVSDMAKHMTCLTLVYSDIEEAVALVRKVFSTGSAKPQIGDLGPPLDLLAQYDQAPPADLDLVFERSSDVVERVIGSDMFLWQMDRRNFFCLNPVGGAVWSLLDQPASGHDLSATLQLVFPDVPIDTISTDLAKLLGQMHARGLLTT